MKRQHLCVSLLFLGMLGLAACAGLEQYPDSSTNYNEDLRNLDNDYKTALEKIEAAIGHPDAQKQIRDAEIDRRLRVIDRNFDEFRKHLTRENSSADFGVAVVQVGIGAAGSLVAETASQILSAASGGLAGVQQAYSKAALFDKTVSALLAQMIATRKAVLVRIYEGRLQSVATYPLAAAVQDLDAYEFAGSLPGALVGTTADATVKNEEAEGKIETLVVGLVPKVLQERREKAATFVKLLKPAELDRLADSMGVAKGNDDGLTGILLQILAAETNPAFDEIAQKIKILFGREF